MPGLYLNGIDVKSLMGILEGSGDEEPDPTAQFGMKTVWRGRTSAESVTTKLRIAGQEVPRRFRVRSDVPAPLCGTDRGASPEELLLAALNACLTVSYAAGAAARGIEIDALEIETEGELDLRGALGLDDRVDPGFQRLDCRVRIRADTSETRLRMLHEAVLRTSPNLFHMTRAIRIRPELVS